VMRIFRNSIFILVAATISGSVAVAETDIVSTSDNVFFAPQSPILAQADDEWGVSTGLAPLNERVDGYKSPSRAAMFSLLLPGLGEIYVGDSKTRAITFISADIGIWGAFFTYHQMSNWKEDDFRQLAISKAGVDPEGKTDHFWDMVGFYDNRDEYNKISRVYSRENPFFPETEDWDWQWTDIADRGNYRDIKNDSKAFSRNADWMLAAAGLNRAVSAFFAWRAAKGHNRSLIDEFSKIRFDYKPDELSGSATVMISYSTSF